MTDERQGERLWDALAALPRGAGVVARHHSLAGAKRRTFSAKLARIARRRGLVVVEDDMWPIARVHDHAELRRALADGVALVFISPVFATRSHPGGRSLGRAGFARLARKSRVPVIALGGMNAARFRQLRRFGAYGWGAIDALTPDQKRKAVPR